MQFDSNTPIWLQIANILKEETAIGKLNAGDKLPGGRDLALRFGVNPNTAARVYKELESEGMCETRRGLGTFITEDTEKLAGIRQEMAKEAVRKCIERLRRLGISHDQAIGMLKEEEEHET